MFYKIVEKAKRLLPASLDAIVNAEKTSNSDVITNLKTVNYYQQSQIEYLSRLVENLYRATGTVIPSFSIEPVKGMIRILEEDDEEDDEDNVEDDEEDSSPVSKSSLLLKQLINQVEGSFEREYALVCLDSDGNAKYLKNESFVYSLSVEDNESFVYSLSVEDNEIPKMKKDKAERIYKNLQAAGPEFWDNALEDYVDEEDKLVLVKDTLQMIEIKRTVSIVLL